MQLGFLAYARVLTVLVLVLGLVGIGFAHDLDRPQDDTALAAYVANGGSLDDICNGDKAAHAGPGCEACLIQAASMVPSQIDVVRPSDLMMLRAAGVTDTMRVTSAAFDFSHAERAPPRV